MDSPTNDENKSPDLKNAKSIFEFTVKDLDGNDVSLEKFRGKVCLVVNVASNCGLTKNNYKQLNEMYAQYREKGLEILAFPCNQFAGQEPACETDLKEFIKKNNIEFPFFAKVNVNGANSIPLYSFLKNKQGGLLGNFIKWNFTKFLCNKDGEPVKRYGPSTEPKSIHKDMEELL
ncbi:glutathione peroxidase 1-like [Brevipalpus obovatus]|uniref:glutathione peroxidase 1-like n=1 Tax=Brevipalpus obovatus TaxID=246614 RepID=UPI003D9F0319